MTEHDAIAFIEEINRLQAELHEQKQMKREAEAELRSTRADLAVASAHLIESEEDLNDALKLISRLESQACATAFEGASKAIRCYWCKKSLGHDEEFIKLHTLNCPDRLKAATQATRPVVPAETATYAPFTAPSVQTIDTTVTIHAGKPTES